MLLSGDTDGSGIISGSLSGKYGPPGDTINFNSGVISGGLSGSFTATGTTQGYPPPAGTLSGSGTLSDGSTFTVSGGYGGPISGGNIQFSGTSSDGDTITGSGTFSGTEDQNYNITSGTFTITTFTVLDPNTWEPVSGGDYLWSDPDNWSNKVVPVNGASATFDSTYNNTCYVNVATTQGTLILQNGFTAPFQIQGNGAALDIPAYDDSNNAGGTFNVNFLAANAPVNYNGGVTYNIRNNINYGTGGKVNITNGSVVNYGTRVGLTQQSGSPINVTNGTLNFGDGKKSGNYSTFQLTNASADINVTADGTVNLYQTGKTLIDNSANPGAVISNSGVVNLQGVINAIGTKINVPLQNHDTLNVNGGLWNFGLKDASGNDLSMDGGAINTYGFPSITCVDNYTQTGGVFKILGNAVTLNATVINFNGGTVEFAYENGAADLFTNNSNIVFNGATLDMEIWGGSDVSDEIWCNNCTIKGSSTINVTMEGSLQSYTWTLIKASTGVNGDFQTVNLPPNVDEYETSTAWECTVF